jgi:hypothetical protein
MKTGDLTKREALLEPGPLSADRPPTRPTHDRRTPMNHETNDHTNDPDRDHEPARPRVEHDPGGCIRIHSRNPLAAGPIIAGFVSSTPPAEWIEPAAWRALAVLTEANLVLDDEHARDVPPELRGERSRE